MFQFVRILAFCFLGELLHAVLPLPIPASIYGLVLLLAALCLGIVRLDQVQETGMFLTGIFPLLFVPAAAGVMELWTELGGYGAAGGAGGRTGDGTDPDMRRAHHPGSDRPEKGGPP